MAPPTEEEWKTVKVDFRKCVNFPNYWGQRWQTRGSDCTCRQWFPIL